ncbi:MAG TPA: hypothetical protein VHK91_17705 [Flavisolibacter sp.]|nr:hypothetical protein [Flavisolibacter sp.]
MRMMKWLTLAAVCVLILSCFFTWVTIPSRDITVSGFHSEGTSFGKPGIFHMVLSALFIGFLLINRIWSKKVAFFIGAFNVAWATRNFIAISACSGGTCPEKHAALYMLLFSSVLAALFTLLIDAETPPVKA